MNNLLFNSSIGDSSLVTENELINNKIERQIFYYLLHRRFSLIEDN